MFLLNSYYRYSIIISIINSSVSRNTVSKVVKRAWELDISWPLDFDMTGSALEELMFPKNKTLPNKRMPDFDYIRKELLRNGVNKKLLWVEYREGCRLGGEEPLMYSQLCYYIQTDELALMVSLSRMHQASSRPACSIAM